MIRDCRVPTTPDRVEAYVLAPGLDGAYRLELSAGSIRGIVPIAPAELVTPSDDPRLLRFDSRFVIVPGFVDGHTHLLGVGTSRSKPDLHDAESKQEALDRLAQWLAAHPGDDPVIAEGWDQSLWKDPAFPTRAELDAIAGTRPAVCRRVCGHIAVFSSAALARVGTNWENLDEESGIAREQLPLSIGRLLPMSPEVLAEAAAVAADVALSRGVTWAHEMGDARSFRAFSSAGSLGRFPVRVSHYFMADLIDSLCATGVRTGFGDQRLRVAGIKFFLDGSFGGRTAALRGSYADASGSGDLLWTDANLEASLRRCAEADLPVAMHAIGDRAILQAISVIERLKSQGIEPASPGPRLEHAESLAPDLFERACAAGFFFSMQPNFTARWQGQGQLYEQALGAERAMALNPYRRALGSGRLVFGSDTMPLDPALGISGAVEHPDPSQRLSGMEALQAYTTGSASAVRSPFHAGRLEPGSPADFVVLRADSRLGKLLRAGNAGARDNVRGEGVAHGRSSAGSGVYPRATSPSALDVVSTWIDGDCKYHAPSPDPVSAGDEGAA